MNRSPAPFFLFRNLHELHQRKKRNPKNCIRSVSAKNHSELFQRKNRRFHQKSAVLWLRGDLNLRSPGYEGAEKGVPYVSTSLIRPRKREFLGFETTTEMPVSVFLHRSASEVHQQFEKTVKFLRIWVTRRSQFTEEGAVKNGEHFEQYEVLLGSASEATEACLNTEGGAFLLAWVGELIRDLVDNGYWQKPALLSQSSHSQVV